MDQIHNTARVVRPSASSRKKKTIGVRARETPTKRVRTRARDGARRTRSGSRTARGVVRTGVFHPRRSRGRSRTERSVEKCAADRFRKGRKGGVKWLTRANRRGSDSRRRVLTNTGAREKRVARANRIDFRPRRIERARSSRMAGRRDREHRRRRRRPSVCLVPVLPRRRLSPILRPVFAPRAGVAQG